MLKSFVSRSDTELRELLEQTHLQFIADNIHAEWRSLDTKTAPLSSVIATWCSANTQPDQLFFILMAEETGHSLYRSKLLGNATLCKPVEGLTPFWYQATRRRLYLREAER